MTLRKDFDVRHACAAVVGLLLLMMLVCLLEGCRHDKFLREVAREERG